MTDPAELPWKERCLLVLDNAFDGLHHCPGYQVHPHGDTGWVSVCVPHDLATFDGDKLTRLVFAGHDYAVRVELANGGPHRVKLLLHPRTREGRLYYRHPSLATAVAAWREHHPAELPQHTEPKL